MLPKAPKPLTPKLMKMKWLYSTVVVWGLVFAAAHPAMAQSPTGSILTEEAAVNQAVNARHQLAVARLRIQQAQNDNTPGAAGFLPIISTGVTQTASLNNQRLSLFTGETRTGSNALGTSLNANLLVEWWVYEGGGRYALCDRLANAVTHADAARRAELEATIAQTLSAYYALASEYQLMRVFRETMSFSRLRLTLAEARVAAGAAPGLTVLQARVDMNADSLQILTQELAVTQRREDLNRLLGTLGNEAYAVDTTVVLEAIPSLAELENRLQQHNTATEIQRIRMADFALAERQTHSALRPRVGFTGAYNLSYTTAQVGLLQSNLSYGPQVGVTASWMLYDGRNARRQTERAQLEIQIAAQEYDQVLQDLRLTLHRQYAEHAASQQRLEVERANLALASEAQRIAFEQFRIGVITDIQLRENQLAVVAAGVRVVQAIHQTKQAEIRLRQLAGLLLTDATE